MVDDVIGVGLSGTSSRRTRPVRSVGAELRLLFRAIAAIAVTLLVCNVGDRLFLLVRLRPQVQRLQLLTTQLDDFNAAMVDEETGLRGYLATGAQLFLQPYTAAVPALSAASARLSERIPRGALTTDLDAVRLTQHNWDEQWVKLAVDPSQANAAGAATGGRPNVALLTEFLDAGKVLFDDYRLSHDRFERDINSALAKAGLAETRWLVWSGVVQAFIALLAVAVAFGAGHRLRRLVAAPVASLAKTVADIRAGNLRARVSITAAPAELIALSADVDEMAVSLQAKSELAERRERDAHRYSDRLELVLGVAREVAGSLSLPYVLDTVTAAACRLGCRRARAWLVEVDERTITLAFDTETGVKSPLPDVSVIVGVGPVGRAVKYSKPVGPEPAENNDETILAVPMIVGGRVVGVLECLRPRRADDTAILQILEALAGHAAGSIEAARLHEHTRELAATDALTGLPNRRAFDGDIDNEIRRAGRHGRALSVVYFDLDHFKELNDRYGHDHGDTALQQAAAAVRLRLRDTDRCYRVGGEEFIVIVPETDAADAAIVAERLRAAVADSAGPDAPTVTASFGVADFPFCATDAAGLVRAADRAVYAAKASGRNQVVIAAAAALAPHPAAMPPAFRRPPALQPAAPQGNDLTS